MLCLLTASPPQQLCLAALTWLPLKCFHTLSQSALLSFADDTDSISEGLLPHSLHLLQPYYIVPCGVMFVIYHVSHALPLSGGTPKSQITPPSQTVFLFRFSIDMSVPGRIIMAVQSNQWWERYHVTEMSQVWLLNQLICVHLTPMSSLEVCYFHQLNTEEDIFL